MHLWINTERAGAVPDDLESGGGGESSLVVVSLAAVTWDFRLRGRTRMLTEAWARIGHPTIFVQVPSYRTALQRIASPVTTRESVPVVRPWPTYPSQWWSKLGAGRLGRAIRRRAIGLRRQLDKQLSWDRAVALVVSPRWAPWLDELPFRHVIYDCIDELEVHVRRRELAALYRSWEDRLVARASGAVVTAKRLGEALHARRPDLPVTLIRNGADVDCFQSSAASTPRPHDVPATGRPIVGFVGALYEWIDWELIHETAQQLSEYEFVFLGPRDGRGNAKRVGALPNVRLLGRRPYERVPAYVDTFDVCWVPFKEDEVGTAANPVKIYEYLSLGKPVVTTPVADTDSFGDLVEVARTPAEMVARLRAAVTGSSSATEARMEYARRNAWDARARQYLQFIASLETV